MRDKPIHITRDDLRRLRRMLSSAGAADGVDSHLVRLREDLRHAVTVPAIRIPFYVVTMRSLLRLKDLDTGVSSDYALVYPGESGNRRGQLSVLSPIGAALLGREELDTVAWQSPAGDKHVLIERVVRKPARNAAEVYRVRPSHRLVH